MKNVADLEESSFAFKMDDFYRRKTTVCTRLMVDARATIHIIKNAKKLKNYNQTFQPENQYIEVAYRTKNIGVALKRSDAEVCLRDANENCIAVTPRNDLLIPS